jgi:hypothetical protein
MITNVSVVDFLALACNSWLFTKSGLVQYVLKHGFGSLWPWFSPVHCALTISASHTMCVLEKRGYHSWLDQQAACFKRLISLLLTDITEAYCCWNTKLAVHMNLETGHVINNITILTPTHVVMKPHAIMALEATVFTHWLHTACCP